MSNWMLIVAATACGGALLLWHAVSRTKHLSEQLLRTYRQMLAESRAHRSSQYAPEANPAANEPAKPTTGPPTTI